jgi:hypothetical protein
MWGNHPSMQAMIVNRTPINRSILVIAAVALALLPCSVQALSVSPGLAMVQNIPLGQEVNLGKLGLSICGHNDGDEVQTFAFKPEVPSGTWGRDWEAGYEAFPDVSWCRMEEGYVDAQPKDTANGALILNIPDRPENYNRKWVIYVLVQKDNRKARGIGAGMAIAVRLMIETVVNDKVDGAAAGPLAFIPGTITVPVKPGEKTDFAVKLRNNSGLRLTCKTERLNQIYSKPHKYPRYTTTGCEALLKDSWTTPADELFSLEADATMSFKLNVVVPPDVDASKKYEELVFVRGTGPVNGDDGTQGMAAMTFIRIRYKIVAEQPQNSPDQPQPSPAPEK